MKVLRVAALALAAPALLHSVALATCASTEACLQAIATAQQGTRTVSAEFVQVKHVTLLDEPLVSSGHFLFKRPDRILLQIETPLAATVVIKGRDVHIPNLPERDRQAMAMAPVATMFTQLGAIFTGAVEGLQDSFEVTARPDDTGIAVTLRPRRPDWQRMYRSIELRFAGPELSTQQIRLEDALGDHLDITMRNVRRNVELPDTMFDVRGE